MGVGNRVQTMQLTDESIRVMLTENKRMVELENARHSKKMIKLLAMYDVIQSKCAHTKTTTLPSSPYIAYTGLMVSYMDGRTYCDLCGLEIE